MIILTIKEKNSQFSFNKYVNRREFELIFATKPTIRFVIDAHPNSAELGERERGRARKRETEGEREKRRFSVKITHAETHARSRGCTQAHARTQTHAVPFMD